jgi:DNA repair protein RadC
MRIRDCRRRTPREKLLARGAGVLSDAELLALFLGSGLRGRDAVATARELLSEHGPLRAPPNGHPGS